MTDISVIIPVAPYHLDRVTAAVASCAAQTVPVEVLVVIDRERRGAGWARNRGLADVATPYVVFLDADDELLPRFAEATLAQAREGAWVYTDWLDEDTPYPAPACPWGRETRNVITTLVPTSAARAVGGFDETLGGLEDTDFYLKLRAAGLCGVCVREPLFRYRKGGERSKAFYDTPEYHAAMRRFSETYGRKLMGECGGCGGGNVGPFGYDAAAIIGEKQDGDVLAVATWGGNRIVHGFATGRVYPRTGNGKQTWVDPRDAAAAPHLYHVVAVTPDVHPASPTPGSTRVIDGERVLTSLADVARLFVPELDTTDRAPVPPVKAKPNTRKARQLYRRAANG